MTEIKKMRVGTLQFNRNKKTYDLLRAGIHSEKCVPRQFHHCTNIIRCPYTNLDSLA